MRQEFEAKYFGNTPPRPCFLLHVWPKMGKGMMTKTEAAQRWERAWALFQTDWIQDQPSYLLAVCPQASYLASLNLRTLFLSSMHSVPCGLQNKKL